MFCPQCGHEHTAERAERVRFCTNCRFPLSGVKELLQADASAPQDESQGRKYFPLRQQDITLGALLMLVGACKAFLLTLAVTPAHNQLTFGLLFAALALAMIQLIAQLTPRQRGLSLGATLLFLATVVAFVAAAATNGMAGLLVAAIALPVILCWLRLTRMVSRFFFAKAEEPEPLHHAPAQLAATGKNGMLAAAVHFAPVVVTARADAGSLAAGLQSRPDPQPVERAAALPSVTENTTELLRSKRQ